MLNDVIKVITVMSDFDSGSSCHDGFCPVSEPKTFQSQNLTAEVSRSRSVHHGTPRVPSADSNTDSNTSRLHLLPSMLRSSMDLGAKSSSNQSKVPLSSQCITLLLINACLIFLLIYSYHSFITLSNAFSKYIISNKL